MRYPVRLIMAIALLLSAGIAHAHPQTLTLSFLGGFSHPWLGLDHVLAMFCIGILANTANFPHFNWRYPACFLALLTAGMFSHPTIPTPASLEELIAGSVSILGLTLLLRHRIRQGIILALIAASGFLHGLAHGLETPSHADNMPFAGGMITASCLLHMLGLLWGRMTTSRKERKLYYLSGIAISGTGLFLL